MRGVSHSTLGVVKAKIGSLHTRPHYIRSGEFWQQPIIIMGAVVEQPTVTNQNTQNWASYANNMSTLLKFAGK